MIILLLVISLTASFTRAFKTFQYGPTFDVTYDECKKMLRYEVSVPENMYFGLVFGKEMKNVDLMIFYA